ncbi:MAG: ABC transporter substrate-binding protein [Pseudobutyrivibrio sp.]|uniref:ABC transporter substrate-binding protein n=1 Tax=Pseudobutyrivibrio sp. TaxID=2014367 RepID=UPI0025F0417A|nr:ABC transporter substrate-binding protein [Pseudobutyrivibrio sp.]MBQ8489069.1 ABC transporter substrate-binding protein [Pseudobutyrivibrio sp.]
MKKKILSMGLCAALTASLFAGCGANGGAATSTETVDTSGELTWRLGGIGPITGGAAQYGQGVMNAIQIAVDEVNEAGGINGYKVSFNFQDDETDPQKAVNAYNTLKDWGMQILEGTVTSGACAAVSAETYNDRIFQLTPSASSTSVTEGHDNTFQICFSDPNQGTVSADYIAENSLGTKIGIIYDSSDPYSSGVYQNFAKEAANVGLEIVATEAFTADNKTDFSTQLQKCKDAGADLLFLPFYYQEGSVVLKQAHDMSYAPIMFGVDGFDGLLGVKDFDVSLAEGVYLLTPFAADATDDATKNFVTKYEEQFGGTPNQFAADAYDGVYILKEALESAGLTPEASNEEICEALIGAIQNVNYNGLTGEGMTWNEKGEVSKSPKAVIIENGGYVSVE